jgi:murein DD-endopeptidase MepM/ murein hydrolase activator NlpD
MASTTGPGRRRTSGRHRRPGRAYRARVRVAGVASLATASVAGSLAAPAAAAPPLPVAGQTPAPGTEPWPASGTGLTGSTHVADSLAASLAEQAREQEAAARVAAERAAREAAERAERKRERAMEVRAARAAERAALQRHVAPVAGSRVSTAYGAGGAMWSSGSHTGVDFHAPAGASVRSVAAGEVVEAGWSGAYGYQVVVRHADGMYTQYGHLSSVTVAVGAQVTAGTQVGRAGSTGNSSGPHLHFEVRTGPGYGADVPPLRYLRAHGVDV